MSTRSLAARVLLAAVLTGLSAGVLIWAQMPAWERQHTTRVARARARSLVAGLASLSGRLGMTEEIRSGTEQTAAWRYQLTEALSRARDRL